MQPTTDHPQPTTFSLLTEERLPLRGDLHLPETEGAPVVVCIHGFKGFKDWGFWPIVASRLAGAGLAAARFNFSHSGVGEDLQTFSNPHLFETGTYSREVEDLRLILRELVARRLPGSNGLDTGSIGLLAHSRGAVAALAVAASKEFPVRSVALWNPVARVIWWDEATRSRWRETGFWEVVNARTRQVFRMRTGLLDDAEQNAAKLDPAGNAALLDVPLLVLVAADDESVPADSGRSLARAVAPPRGTLVELPGTGHTFGATHPPGEIPAPLEQAVALTERHFARTLAGG